MLTRCILAERKKLRHSLILPACILIPIIPAIMGTFNYLQNGILSGHSILYFMPASFLHR